LSETPEKHDYQNQNEKNEHHGRALVDLVAWTEVHGWTYLSTHALNDSTADPLLHLIGHQENG
jgi:hypothetical protein